MKCFASLSELSSQLLLALESKTIDSYRLAVLEIYKLFFLLTAKVAPILSTSQIEVTTEL